MSDVLTIKVIMEISGINKVKIKIYFISPADKNHRQYRLNHIIKVRKILIKNIPLYQGIIHSITPINAKNHRKIK